MTSTTAMYDDTQHTVGSMLVDKEEDETTTAYHHGDDKSVKLRIIFVNHDGKPLEEEFSVILIFI